MEICIQCTALGLSLGGALLLALADAWLSRSILVYLDAIESNVTKLVEALRAGSLQIIVTNIDLKRDRSQNVARALKTLGWLSLSAGFALQIAAIYLIKSKGA